MPPETRLAGFVDLQVNGFLGVDFSSPDLTEESFMHACRELSARGTAMFMPTLITSPLEIYSRNLPVIARAMDAPELRGRLPGIHLEGPFLFPDRDALGAHNPDLVRPPDTSLFESMQKWANGKIRLITIAADLEGASEFTRYVSARGVTVSLGHHLATAEDLERQADAGARALTHLGNGMPTTVHRHNNPLFAGLCADRLTAMIISDGHHLPPSVIKVILRSKGVDRVVVASDASPLAGLPPGEHSIYGMRVILEESGRLYNPRTGHFVGSSATMLQCVNHLASLGFLPLEDLLKVAIRNPLKLVGAEIPEGPAERRVLWDERCGCFALIA